MYFYFDEVNNIQTISKNQNKVFLWEGKEDYRWAVLRARPEFQAKWKWTLFNLFFICGYQQILILLFTLPIIIALQFNETPFGFIDIIIAGLMLFFIIYETIADNQHWKFQSEKWKKIYGR